MSGAKMRYPRPSKFIQPRREKIIVGLSLPTVFLRLARVGLRGRRFCTKESKNIRYKRQCLTTRARRIDRYMIRMRE